MVPNKNKNKTSIDQFLMPSLVNMQSFKSMEEWYIHHVETVGVSYLAIPWSQPFIPLVIRDFLNQHFYWKVEMMMLKFSYFLFSPDQLLCAGHGGENGSVFRFRCQKL